MAAKQHKPTSLKTIISRVNSTKSHQLEKQVKNLEAERDMRLLNLQMKKDEMFFGSPNSQRRKILVKSPSVSEGLRAGTPSSQQEILDLNAGLSKEEEFSRLQKAHNLPPLYLDRAGIVATPPRIRKARNLHPGSFPVPITPSRLAESPKPEHKLLTRQSSSPQMLSSSNSMTNVNETRREEHLESKQRFSPRLQRTNIDSSVLLNSPTSPKALNFDQPSNFSQIPRRPATAVASIRDSNSSEVHRGLILLPVSSSKEQTKTKEQKKDSVFNRLYSSTKKRDRKRIGSDDSAPQALHLPHGKLKAKLETRRRSVSLSDLSEICDKLKTCRYLRSNSQNEDSKCV
ncbi:hypothetical protein AWC38_SpisGene18872 [Stylophora pistillata]|uniref:Uncharacterized protein n=1 Tax=Stylophora pistillata TaxID=50429 RepID=A0A2B4RGU6_STYPI|nr:hypothetical protein AWC38_SpisGene18872 [Stylophora pistillata]